MRIKICGITNLSDAIDAISAGADALGFVFYEKSPRYITPLKAKEIIKSLPPFIERVGLFVNESSEKINEISKLTNISLAQIHFEAEPKLYEELNIKHIKVIRAQTKEDLNLYSNEYRLVDAFVEEFGGAGKRINLDWFSDIDCSKIIIAGGLTPENLNELKEFNFYGVDVSSGVEEKKGIKNSMKVKKFINIAKSL